jgi:uncharacterized protein with HXXEE motif
MNNRLRIAFQLLIVLQLLHSLEEFVFKFYERFPPMVFVYRNSPGMARTAFILFNSILFLAGLVSLLYWVWPARRGMIAVVWVWVGAETLNVIAHCVWAVLIRSYNPGLVTGIAFLPVLAYLVRLLRRLPQERQAKA